MFLSPLIPVLLRFWLCIISFCFCCFCVQNFNYIFLLEKVLWDVYHFSIICIFLSLFSYPTYRCYLFTDAVSIFFHGAHFYGVTLEASPPPLPISNICFLLFFPNFPPQIYFLFLFHSFLVFLLHFLFPSPPPFIFFLPFFHLFFLLHGLFYLYIFFFICLKNKA